MLEEVVRIVERDLPDEAFLATRWPALREDARSRWDPAAGAAEREAVVTDLLSALDVSHCLLISPTVQADIEGKTADPRRLAPTFRRVGDTWVAAIRSFKAGTTTADDLRLLARHAAEAKRVVLDLRLNDGGSGGLVAEACGLFLPPGTPVLRVRRRGVAPDARPHIVSTFREDATAGHEAEVHCLLEHEFVEYRVPEDPVGRVDGAHVVVVSDARCYSCGEVFVQALQEHGVARVAGKPTAGMVVAARGNVLDEGYSVLFPFAEMCSGRGVVLEGRGARPDIDLEVGPLDDEGLVAALEGAGCFAAP